MLLNDHLQTLQTARGTFDGGTKFLIVTGAKFATLVFSPHPQIQTLMSSSISRRPVTISARTALQFARLLRLRFARGQESAGGRKLPECCDAVASGCEWLRVVASGCVKRDQMGPAPFEHGIGQSEPDARAARRSWRGTRLGFLNGSRPVRRSRWRIAGLAWRTDRRGERRLDLALSEILQHHPQEADARGGRARPPRRQPPSSSASET